MNTDKNIIADFNNPTPTPTPTATSTATPTATSTLTPTPPTDNYALRFQPTSNPKVILMPLAPNLNFGLDMTIEFWIRTTSVFGGTNWYNSQWILDKDVPGFTTPDWGVALRSGKITTNLSSGVATVNNGTWHHIAITRNPATGQQIFYVDGVQDAVNSGGTNSQSNSLALIVGSENGAGGPLTHAFAGDLDELRLWNIVRSQSEIQANMSGALSGSEPGLMGYWNFNEGSGQIAHDKTSTQAHGQLGNSVNGDNYDPEWILVSYPFNLSTPTPLPATPTSTSLPPNVTPQPTSTATLQPTTIPTAAATLAPCSNPCTLECIRSWFGFSSSNNNAANFHTVAYNVQQALFDIQLFHRVEDEILSQTPQGQNYIDLYYGHGLEISEILRNDASLIDEAIATLQLWEPNLQALVDGQGGDKIISSGQVQAVQTFLDHLYAAGSIELRQTIDAERAANPLEQTIGLNMVQASSYFIDFQGPPTITPTNTLTPTPTSTSTSTPTPPPGLIFADGFESGDFSAWNWTDTDGGDFSVTAQAAGSGSYGIQVVVDDNHQMAISDDSPNNEALYTARFYFNPNSVQISSTGGVNLFNASASTGWAACLYMDQEGDHYSLTLCGEDDAVAWFESDAVLIADEWQSVEIEWKAATTAGTNDGYIRIYVGDQLAASIENLDNDTYRITDAQLAFADSFTASGTMYFDAFESRAGGHIGLDPNGPPVSPAPSRPDLMFSDTFETGNPSEWNPTRTKVDGGDLSVTASAAYQSGYGLNALIDDTAVLYAVDSSPAFEKRYRARFYFNPNSLAMGNNTSHFIFDGYNTNKNDAMFRLELFYEGGTYKLRPRILRDDWGYTNGSKYVIGNDWHVIEIDWNTSTAPGANNGYLSLWIDGTLAGAIANVDNDLAFHRVDEARLGATGGLDAATSGSMLFDNFESRRETYIGQ
jgi:hypothetical protein